MNHSGDFVVYSYALGDQACTTLNPANIVQVIPAIIQANCPTIRIVENIQIRPPTKPLSVQQLSFEESSPYHAIKSDANAPPSVLVQEGTAAFPTQSTNENNTIALQIPAPQPEQTPSTIQEKKIRKPPTKKAIAKLKQMQKMKPPDPDLDLDPPVPAKVKQKPSGIRSKKGFIFECDICDSRFLAATSLKLHKTGHRYADAEEKKPWVCRFCGRHFSHQQTLGDHEKVHIDEYRYNCEACGAKYNSKSGLRNHLAKNEACNESFRDRKLLRKKEEEDEKKYGCDVCGKKYRHRKSMVEHRSLHYKSKQHKCERCGAMFETTGGWRKHKANGRCEFSKSKFKDAGGDNGEESVFIPEDRKKFLEQVKQLEQKQPVQVKKRCMPKRKRRTRYSSSDDDRESLPEVRVDEEKPLIELVTISEIVTVDGSELSTVSNDVLPSEKEVQLETISVEYLEIKDETPSGDESVLCFVDKGSSESPKTDVQIFPESIPNESPEAATLEDTDTNPTKEDLEEKPAEESRVKKPRKPKIHQCPTCNKIFARSFVLKNHMRTHTGERPFLCDTCSKSFSDLATLKGHQVIHTGEKAFSCSECSARFARKSGLRNHITVHFNLPCDECDQKFPSRKTLMRHKIKHQGIRPFLCDICSKDFRTKADMQAHLRIHSNEKRYACPICSARFNCPSTLRRHRNVHAPPETRPVCESCGKSFSSQQALRKHENIHKNLKPFQCDVCAKCFRVKDHLRIHQRSHSGEKPFSCELCPKRFVTNGDLRVHLRRHTGEKPYSCDECGEAFVVTAGLYRHMQQSGHQSSKPQAIIVPEVKRAT
ncbi:zinc finger protein 250-like [Ochlerotatus camptorhynchus]|uniref:zinc finger protein 250-like n=1 Tax=Ochlerotatus camptorhynchus TaxID=644619 RepID=UPI0031D6D91D